MASCNFRVAITRSACFERYRCIKHTHLLVKNKSAQSTHPIILVNHKVAHAYTRNEGTQDFYLLASAEKKNLQAVRITTNGNYTNEKLKKKKSSELPVIYLTRSGHTEPMHQAADIIQLIFSTLVSFFKSDIAFEREIQK